MPPCVADVERSAWVYSSKTFATPSALIPSPSSVTLNSIISISSFTIEFTSKVTTPLLVNLKALLKKLVTHCLSFVSSCVIAPMASCMFILNPLSFFEAKGALTSLRVSTNFSISKLVR